MKGRKWLVALYVFLLVLSLIAVPNKVGASSTGDQVSYWTKTYGGSGDDGATAVALAPNGDIIVAGYTTSFGAGGNDIWVLRLDENGNIKWQKTYGGSDDDGVNAVALAPNGDIILAGETWSFGAGTPDHSNAWVLRLDGEGNVKWQKTYGGSGDDGVNAVALAPNGDIIVAGYTTSFGAGGNDFWVLRLDANGNVKWQKTYGGGGDDGATSIAIAPNGDIIVAGYTTSFGAGGNDIWVLRLDENGNIKWQKTYGGSTLDEAYAVALAPNGDVIVAGHTYSFGAGYEGVWVLRLDENGNIKWQKTYEGDNNDGANALAIAPNGDIIVAGYTWSFGAGWEDFWVLRLDENGNIKWQKTYGGSNIDVARAIALAPNGDIIVAGYTTSFGAGGFDFWVLRLDENGGQGVDLAWLKCGIDSNATIITTDASMKETNAQISMSDASVKDSNAAVNSTSVEGVPLLPCKITSGKLTVDSTPSGAGVYLNGIYTGVTPLELSNLTPGTYEVKITLNGYENYTTSVTLAPGERKVLNVTLTPTFGYLTITSNPSGATVIVDGQEAGSTPLKEYRLSVGQHRIAVKMEGYEEKNFTVTIEAGREVRKSVELTPVQTTTTTPPTTTTSPGEGVTTTTTTTSTTSTTTATRTTPPITTTTTKTSSSTATTTTSSGVSPTRSTSTPGGTTSTPTTTTTKTKGKGSICGPAALIGLAIVPLLLRKRSS